MGFPDCCQAADTGAPPAEHVPSCVQEAGYDTLHVRSIRSRESRGSNLSALGGVSDITVESPAYQMSKIATSGNLEHNRGLCRGISLRRTLRLGGQLWRQHGSQDVYELSSPVSNFDIFVSHTWMTPSLSKVLALLLQTSCRWLLLWQAVALGLVALLTVLDVLPLPWESGFNLEGAWTPAPIAPWSLLASFLALILGLLTGPYIPDTRGILTPSDVCFWDAACIHQTDMDLKTKGIYAIADFLRISRELRVLWSPAYLSRLWCVFEVAAFRKANPAGKLNLSPLFIELTVLMCLLCNYGICILFFVARTNTDGGSGFLILSVLAGGVPALVGVHMLRKNFVTKHKLLVELHHFSLTQVECSSDFDRDFIYHAIRLWYGSTEAFEEFVRGPLRQELLSAIGVVPGYSFLIGIPCLSLCVDWLLSLSTLQSSTEINLSFFLSFCLGFSCLWCSISLKVVLFVCDRMAMPWQGVADFAKTFVAWVILIFIVVGVLAAYLTYRQSLWASIGWLAAAFLLVVAFARFPRSQKPPAAKSPQATMGHQVPRHQVPMVLPRQPPSVFSI